MKELKKIGFPGVVRDLEQYESKNLPSSFQSQPQESGILVPVSPWDYLDKVEETLNEMGDVLPPYDKHLLEQLRHELELMTAPPILNPRDQARKPVDVAIPQKQR